VQLDLKGDYQTAAQVALPTSGSALGFADVRLDWKITRSFSGCDLDQFRR
jgi:hypothetical protein